MRLCVLFIGLSLFLGPARADEPPGKQLRQLLRDPDRPSFRVREQAQQELGRLGEEAVPALRQALTDTRSAEKWGQ